jgi:branched-chain amino acid transport system substrate-binding protein
MTGEPPRRAPVGWMIACLASVMLAAACGSSAKGPSAGGPTAETGSGGSHGSITVGLMTSFTGPQAAGFTTVAAGFDSRIALQNAAGGVDGRKIKVVNGDDQGTPTGALAAGQTLASQDGALALATVSTVAYGAAHYFTENNVPVVGSPIDSDEWAPPNSNMFPTYGSYSSKYPAPRWMGTFFRQRGARSVAVIAFSSPASVANAKNVATSIRAAGLTVGYLNFTLPPTQEGNFGSIIQQIKQQGVDAVYVEDLPTASFAMLAEMAQAGLHVKAVLTLLSPPAAVFQNPQARAVAQGTWTWTPWVPAGLRTPATLAFQAALRKYAHQTAAPDRNEYDGWAAASAFVRGLEAAGPNPTRASFIAGLRRVTDFSADGLLVSPVNFQASFGTGAVGAGPSPGDCVYVQQYVGTEYVPKPQPICGGLIPNSNAG